MAGGVQAVCSVLSVSPFARCPRARLAEAPLSATTLEDALRADPSQASPKPARSRSSRPRAPALDEGQSFARMVAECMKGPNKCAFRLGRSR